MKRTAQKRMVAMVDAYARINNLQGVGVSMTDVAAWATRHGLNSVPRVFDTIELQDAWDERFEQIVLQEQAAAQPQ